MEIVFAQASDKGISRQENQDAMGTFSGPWGRLFVVCDGLGGHAGGAIASRVAVQRIGAAFAEAIASALPAAALEAALVSGNQAVRAAAQKSGLVEMATTCVALFIPTDLQHAYAAHAGDSRIYRIRGQEIAQITRDHTEYQRRLDAGESVPERGPGTELLHLVERSLGPSPELDVSVSEPLPLREGDVYLLCSDGLTTMLDDEDIRRYVGELPPSSAVVELVGLANARGGYDNITVQVVEIASALHRDAPSESGLVRISDLLAEHQDFRARQQRIRKRQRLFVTAVVVVCVWILLACVWAAV